MVRYRFIQVFPRREAASVAHRLQPRAEDVDEVVELLRQPLTAFVVAGEVTELSIDGEALAVWVALEPFMGTAGELGEDLLAFLVDSVSLDGLSPMLLLILCDVIRQT